MKDGSRHPLIMGASVTSLGILAGRVLGMVRDVVTANLLGMSGGVMDALAIALRIPNSFRRLFGEGALAVSYLPVVTTQLEHDRHRAWQLVSVALSLLAVVLTAIVLLAEGVLGVAWLVWGDLPGVGLLLGLVAVLLPYMVLICLAAQVAATLQALTHFSTPAWAPSLLNVCWLLAAWLVAPHFAQSQTAQAYVIAVAVLVSGVLQLGVQLPVLHALGFRFDYNWPAARSSVGLILRTMIPMTLGLAVTQINSLIDSLIAWGLSASAAGPESIAWLGGAVCYPMQPGAVAAIYYGERLYQFPLGILGLAVATAIFPLLSRHAAKGDYRQLGADLTLGLRLVVFLGIPAGLGLILLAEPITRLLFEHGRFSVEDTARTARMIACYSSGVWAYCAMPVVVRGYYALGDRTTPVRVAWAMVGLNLAMNLLLIWPLAEAGLAVATSLAASVQVLALVALFSRRKSPLGWRALGATTARTLLATLVMMATGYVVLEHLPPAAGLVPELLRVLVPLGASVAAFLAVYAAIGWRDLRVLLGGRGRLG
jgi:putative peptidoglycan lipid II flippase